MSHHKEDKDFVILADRIYNEMMGDANLSDTPRNILISNYPGNVTTSFIFQFKLPNEKEFGNAYCVDRHGRNLEFFFEPGKDFRFFCEHREIKPSIEILNVEDKPSRKTPFKYKSPRVARKTTKEYPIARTAEDVHVFNLPSEWDIEYFNDNI